MKKFNALLIVPVLVFCASSSKAEGSADKKPDRTRAVAAARYAPPGMYMKDHYMFFNKGKWHLFAPLGPIGTMWWHEGSEESAEHMVSKDLINWKYVGTAVPAGKRDGYFDRIMGGIAPCVIEHEGRFYMIYSGWDFKGKNPRSFEGFRQGIGIAVSEDLYHWEKPAEFEKDGLEPKGSDPFVARDADNGRWLLFAARSNAVAVYESRDLFHWKEAGFSLTESDLKVGMTGMNPGEPVHHEASAVAQVDDIHERRLFRLG